MVAWEIANDSDRPDAPTRESIERDRLRQLEAIKALRRMLEDVVVVDH